MSQFCYHEGNPNENHYGNDNERQLPVDPRKNKCVLPLIKYIDILNK